MEKAIVAEDVTIGNDVVLGCGEEAPNIKKPEVYAFGIGDHRRRLRDSAIMLRLERTRRFPV